MNERIRELAEQAEWRFADRATGEFSEYDRRLEKFAELIVRECAEELRKIEQEADRAYKAKEVKERNTFDGYDFAEMLKEHFGVEE